MSSKSASRKLSGPGAVSSLKSTLHGGVSDSLRPRIQRPAMNFGPLATLFTFLVLSSLVSPCRAQTNRIFQWSFSGNELSSELPSCRSFSITVKPFNASEDTTGVPPYYMMAFPVNGTPTTTLIGTDESNLAWTVDQPLGSQLLLDVVDSTGSAGGIPPNLFTVVAGQTTQCIPAASTDPPFTVTANVTTTIETCQPWGLTITGGTPPYNLTLAALNSPVVTNVTMGPLDNAFTFIDRADPGTQLIAAISDLNGRWASGTPIVATAGNTNVSCIGLVSSSGNATVIKEQEQAAQAALASAASRKKTGVIAGVVVTIVVLLLLGSAGTFLYLRRRKVQQTAREISPRQFEGGLDGANGPQPFEETGGQILSINAFISPASPTQPRSPKSPDATTVSHSNASASTAPFDRRRLMGPGSDAPSISSSGMSVRNPGNPDRPAFTNFPTASVRRSAKEIEAGLATGNSMHSDHSDAPSDGSSRPLVERSQSAMVPGASAGPSGQRGPYPVRSASVGASNASLGQEIIFQHQDAGVVRELPPPYADRGNRDQEP
ncbi:hypothetical protein DFH07DRAFT_848241 [Mycena maculata]|uniref:Mid2 domain-containing protein n=1 Tax=Mycena maculata TaxID=230809 RepID=A0AAD7HY35_9AGAR|nr:hypothetical protein DFH07DRAFT_848241 [Mycena maculata]